MFPATPSPPAATEPIAVGDVPGNDSTMVDRLTTTGTSPSVSTIPHSVQTFVAVSFLNGSKIFQDICTGSGYPLTSAMLGHGCKCFPVDKLIDTQMELLDNTFLEPSLRICASGIVRYGAAAPNCGELNRLNLQPGRFPALRTPKFLNGLPNLSPSELAKNSTPPYLDGSMCIMLGTDIHFGQSRPPGTTYQFDGIA